MVHSATQTVWASLCSRGHVYTKRGKGVHCKYNNVIIIIIMSCYQHGYPRPSLATSPYRSSPLATSGLHPVSSHSCCMYVWAGRPAFARPYVGVHRSRSLICSLLLLQQCSACLVRLTWIVLVMGGRWPYSCCLVGCCRQDLFNILRNVLPVLKNNAVKGVQNACSENEIWVANTCVRWVCNAIFFRWCKTSLN